MVMNGKQRKYVGIMDEWAKVAQELEGEDLKEKIYDNTLIELCGDLQGKTVLDYGAGPAVVAKRAVEKGANVKVFDVSKDMRTISAEKIGLENVFHTIEQIPEDHFDIVVCNLVLCIVSEEEVANIMKNIKNALNDGGVAYVGFCNPLLYDVPESVIDFRKQTGNKYEENHKYMKVKKEGNYEIAELHRSIEWYKKVFKEAGLLLDDILFTPEYEVNGRKINDFIIFKLRWNKC